MAEMRHVRSSWAEYFASLELAQLSLVSWGRATSAQLNLPSSHHILHSKREVERLRRRLFPRHASRREDLHIFFVAYAALARASPTSIPNQGRSIYLETYKHSVREKKSFVRIIARELSKLLQRKKNDQVKHTRRSGRVAPLLPGRLECHPNAQARM